MTGMASPRGAKALVPHPFRQKRVGEGLTKRHRAAGPSVPHPSLREEWGTRADFIDGDGLT